MSVLSLLNDGAVLAGAAGVLWATSVASAAATSVFASCADRRRDARETLKILVRRRASR
ncbi:hypothetical protein ACWDDN_22180 [Streptomyces griseoruber]